MYESNKVLKKFVVCKIILCIYSSKSYTNCMSTFITAHSEYFTTLAKNVNKNHIL